METTTIEDQLKSAGEFGRHDIYAGDDAWREWFDVCFVDGCSAAKALREQVASAMYAQLVLGTKNLGTLDRVIQRLVYKMKYSKQADKK